MPLHPALVPLQILTQLAALLQQKLHKPLPPWLRRAQT
jgi:hypothetical protein